MSVNLSVEIYKLTAEYPESELYGLVSQLRRSSVSVASNIAEGQGRGSVKEFRQFLKIALGSLLELETQLIISQKVGFINEKQINKILTDTDIIKKMIYRLKKYLFKK